MVWVSVGSPKERGGRERSAEGVAKLENKLHLLEYNSFQSRFISMRLKVKSMAKHKASKARCTSMVLNSVPVEMYRFAYIIDDY